MTIFAFQHNPRTGEVTMRELWPFDHTNERTVSTPRGPAVFYERRTPEGELYGVGWHYADGVVGGAVGLNPGEPFDMDRYIQEQVAKIKPPKAPKGGD